MPAATAARGPAGAIIGADRRREAITVGAVRDEGLAWEISSPFVRARHWQVATSVDLGATAAQSCDAATTELRAIRRRVDVGDA